MRSRSDVRVHAAAALIVALHLALVLHGAARHSAAFDEIFYAPAGYATLTTGDQRINAEHPPVMKLLTGAAWLGTGLDVRGTKGFAEANQALFGYQLIHAGGAPPRALLFRARLAVALLSAALAVLVYAAARRAAGDAAALCALALYALDPLVIAHAGLATLDLGAAAFTLAAALSFPGALRAGGVRRVVPAGVALGLALGTKFSTLPLLGGFAVVAVLLGRGRIPGAPSAAVVARRAGAVLLVAALLLAVVCLPAGPAFFARAFELQRAHAERGHPAFALGHYGRHGWWWYYPVTWALKTPLPVLAFSVAGALALASRARSRPLLVATLATTPILLGAASIGSTIAIGARNLLPITPFVAIAGGIAAADLVAAGRAARRPAMRRLARWSVPAALLWLGAGTLAIHPHELSYGNEAAGGARGLQSLLIDSNVDWGLDLPDLARVVAAQPVRRLYLAYFGGGDPAAYGLASYHWLPALNFAPRLQLDGPDRTGRELLAVSLSSLADLGTPGHDSYAWLHGRTRTATAGGGIAVFDITGDAEAHYAVGASSLARGAPFAAIAALHRAAALAPSEPRAPLRLAEVWAAAERWPEAARACAEAERRRAGSVASSPAAAAACRAALSRPEPASPASAAATAGAATPPPSPR